jgi:hypothetical protein
LVVEDQLANHVRQLVPLPLALASPGRHALAVGGRSANGLDRVGGGTEIVFGDVRDAGGLTSGVCGMPSGTSQVASRTHGVSARRAGLHHPDLAAHPGAGVVDRVTWSRVVRAGRVEEVENVLGARRRPQGEEMVVLVGEAPPAANGHQARIADRRKDHRRSLPVARRAPAQKLGAMLVNRL